MVPEKKTIHNHFGLSYANYLVVPRVVLQSMPESWQHRFVELLEEVEEAIDWQSLEFGYKVTLHEVNQDAEEETDYWGDEVDDDYGDYNRGRTQLPLNPHYKPSKPPKPFQVPKRLLGKVVDIRGFLPQHGGWGDVRHAIKATLEKYRSYSNFPGHRDPQIWGYPHFDMAVSIGKEGIIRVERRSPS